MENTSEIVRLRNQKREKHHARTKGLDVWSILLLVMLIAIFVLAVLDLLG